MPPTPYCNRMLIVYHGDPIVDGTCRANFEVQWTHNVRDSLAIASNHADTHHSALGTVVTSAEARKQATVSPRLHSTLRLW